MASLASLALLVACGSDGTTGADGGAPDAAPDVAPDAAPDVLHDAAPDVALEAAPDAEAGPEAGLDAGADVLATDGAGDVDVVVTFAFPCGPTLVCDAAAQYCLVAGPSGSQTYACSAMPAQCQGTATCACLAQTDAGACPCAQVGIGLWVTCE
jgi:hypothetical protein